MLRPITLLALPCALLLGACGGGNTTPPPPARTDFIQPTQIAGNISDYNKLKGTLEILGKNKEVLSSAVAKTTGDFTIELPNATGATKLSEGTFQLLLEIMMRNDESCTGNVTLSNLAARVYGTGPLQLTQGNTKRALLSNSGSVVNNNSTGSVSLWLYASSAVNLMGEKRCGGALSTSNLYLKFGWNQVFLSFALRDIQMQSVDAASSTWGDPVPGVGVFSP